LLPQDFHPVLQRWWAGRFGDPTPAQAEGWASIRRGDDTLIAAPTGSGKTLAAFLTSIDELFREGVEQGGLPDEVRVIYVSPLKALSADIHKNLAQPRSQIHALAHEMQLPALQRFAQHRLDLEAARGLSFERRRKTPDRIAVHRRRRRQRNARAPHERGRVAAVVRIRGDADARRDVERRAAIVDRLGDARERLRGECVGGGAGFVDQQRELRAADRRNRAVVGKKSTQAFADDLQHQFGRMQAERVAELAQMIEFGDQHGKGCLAACAARDRQFEAFGKERLIRKTRDAVVMRDVPEARFGLRIARHVDDHADVTRVGRVAR